MNLKEKYGNTALIAGASEGLGAAYAHALAAKGFDLVLIARRREALEATADEIKKKYSVKISLITCDLASPDVVEQISTAIGETSIDFLVCNAAASYIGAFEKAPMKTHLDIAQLNAVSTLTLVYHFGNRMIERKRGGIVMMTSLAGFQGSGYVTTYAATKALSRVLAEGLWYEWKKFGVDVIACCSGPIATPNFLNTNPVKASIFEPKPQEPEDVVKECLDKIGKVPSFVSGTSFKIAAFLMQRIFSRKMAINFIGDSTKKIFQVK